MSEKKHIIWVVNSGSSSIKFAIYQTPESTCLCRGLVEKIDSPDTQAMIYLDENKTELNLANHGYSQAMQALIAFLKENTDFMNKLSATGHRVVHGGRTLTQPCVVDAETLKLLKSNDPLAPLHNPANCLGITTCQKLLPDIPHVAVFDTGFHQTIPKHAATYALPYEHCQNHGIRKYGFHGISYDYVSQEVARRLGKDRKQCNMIIAHLGNGGSLCAIKQGQSVDTSMGMTPLAGIPMGTRSGDIDPSIIATWAETTGLTLDKVIQIITRESGLLGVSGISHDMRELVKARSNGHARATLALAIFAYRIACTIASYMVPLQRLDALVFTGGIGENNPWLRTEVAQELAYLDIAIDEKANGAPAEHHGKISTPSSPSVWVIPTQEEQHIAMLTQQVLQEG